VRLIRQGSSEARHYRPLIVRFRLMRDTGASLDARHSRNASGVEHGRAEIPGQKIQVGLVHARKTVQVSVGPDTYQIAVEPGITITAPPTSSRDIRRHKASNYD